MNDHTQCFRLALLAFLLSSLPIAASSEEHKHHRHPHKHVDFGVVSVRDGNWSDPKVWQPPRVPGKGDRVKISRGTAVTYDSQNDAVIRLVQVVGTLRFARDRNTELNVAILKVQNSDECSESGFACDFSGVNQAGEPQGPRSGQFATLDIGLPGDPIPANHTARIRLHHQPGLDKDDAPALVCCSARMEIHGAPLSRTWTKLGKDSAAGDATVTLSEPVTGWRVGDGIIVTSSQERERSERRTIAAIDGTTLRLDSPLKNGHSGHGEFRSEVANLARNVIIESADPDGIRGHTLYHAFSQGGISYARFAHLGKKNTLGRYAIHYHLVGDTMRGSQVLGASIVDSHNRWITIHGTEYLIVRDCVGYQSVGHGYFMEDGTEIYNLLDRNLGVQAFAGKRLPQQVLPFDPNDGAAFWWANGRNTLSRNVACENDQYGYRYDMQRRSNFNSELPMTMPDGKTQVVDVRTIPISRFESNESHSEGLYSVAVAGTDGVGPDTRHPHQLRNLKMWQTHYALRAELPTMLVENVHVNHAAYGIYRPWFENHVYRNLHIEHTLAEPFNRGQDDRSIQHGQITVDGLTFGDLGYGGQMPLIQISAKNLSGDAQSHFRNVTVEGRSRDDRWPLVNLGGGPRLDPGDAKGVPVFIHDYFGKGRHAKVVSTRAKDLMNDGNKYRSLPPLTGDESRAAEVAKLEFPRLLDPVDDLPPATVITRVVRRGSKLHLAGITHDDGNIKTVTVNGRDAMMLSNVAGVVDWEIELPAATAEVVAVGHDAAGNVEQTGHRLKLSSTVARTTD